MKFVLVNGIKWKSDILNIYFCNNKYSQDRVAVLVSKRNGNAVTRNKIKRKVREIIRTNLTKYPPYHDILIKPQLGIENIKYNEIALCIENWKKTQINI